MRVLLVDDNPEFVEEAEDFLSQMPGVTLVGWSFSAAEALDLLRRIDVDLVLLDVDMPGMGGLQAARAIKSRPGAPAVVLISFHDGAAYQWAARCAGAEGFLSKNRLFTDLLPLVRSLSHSGRER